VLPAIDGSSDRPNRSKPAPGNRGGFAICMSRKKHERQPRAEAATPELPVAADAPQPQTPSPGPLRMRLGAGRHAVKAAEVEIHVDGVRLTGGYGIVEFDLHAETWVDVVVIRS
jgi:hypothetical protein